MGEKYGDKFHFKTIERPIRIIKSKSLVIFDITTTTIIIIV